MTDNVAELAEATKKMSPDRSGSASENGDETTSTKDTTDTDSDYVVETATSSDETKSGDNDDGDDVKSEAEDDTRTQEEKDEEAKEKEEKEKQRIKELEIKYKDWPLHDIKEPHDHDVMYGRGGGTNHHPGNKRYRKMVEDRKVKYVNSKRLDKPLVALEIIKEWRAQWPPGRFLKQDEATGLWNDVGEKKAREKTSQALREKAPQIRKQQEEEKNEESASNGDANAEGTAAKGNKKGKVKRPDIVRRDHTFGREYLGKGESLDIEGFTWVKDSGGREMSIGSLGSLPGIVLPPGRSSSRGSIGPPFAQQPPPDYHGRVASGEPRREFSTSSIQSWGSSSFQQFPGAPPPPPPGGLMHQRSGSFTFPVPPSPRGARHQRSGSWNAGGSGREHSFSLNPLPGAIVNRPAPSGTFDSRGSGFWNQPPPPPPLVTHPGFGYQQSGDSMGTIGGHYRQVPSPANSNTSSPPFNTMNINRSWSDGGGPPPPRDFGHPNYNPYPPQYDPQAYTGADTSPSRGQQSNHNDALPRPGMVKRDTSNQNETFESKPHKLKRATLSRDQSATSNRLKQQYAPEVFNRDMQAIQKTTEDIRLGSPVPEAANLEPLSMDGRTTSIDFLEPGDLKPQHLTRGARETSLGVFGFNDLIGDSSNPLNNSNDVDTDKKPPSKPAPLQEASRANSLYELGFDDLIDDR